MSGSSLAVSSSRWFALAWILRVAAAQEPELRVPGPDAKPHVVHRAESKGGLRYTWTIPPGYDGERKVAMTVILHGTGLDHRWGHANHPPKVFRPDDVVVSVDGTSPGPNGSRLFLGEKKDADAFHSFLDEMRAAFVVDRVFLYGHSQGSFFAVYYAGERPDDVTGICAHASGSWTWSKTGKAVQQVAIAFQHGSADPVVPYAQSVGARDHYAGLGFPLLHLRRLESYNHWPNAVRSDETLNWCEAMTTGDPARGLALAERIAAKKRPDEYQWTAVPGFSSAREITRRIATGKPRPFDQDPDATTLARAKSLAKRIEDHAGEHVAALRKQLPAKKALVLDATSDWLGHFVALREDFRGVDAVEAFVKDLGYDELAARHAKDSQKLFDAWYGEDQKAACLAALETLPKAFLCDVFPSGLAEALVTWRGKSKEWKLGKKELAALDLADAWAKGRVEGAKAYAAIWGRWD